MPIEDNAGQAASMVVQFRADGQIRPFTDLCRSHSTIRLSHLGSPYRDENLQWVHVSIMLQLLPADGPSLHMGRMLETYSMWVETLETLMQQQLSRGNAGLGSESGSIRSSVDHHIEIVQEFISNSDYHDGRDIFEVANIMTIIRYAMYWTYRGTDGLGFVETTKSLSPQAYVNILKAGWILQRVQKDQRSRIDECTVIIGALIKVCAALFSAPNYEDRAHFIITKCNLQ